MYPHLHKEILLTVRSSPKLDKKHQSIQLFKLTVQLKDPRYFEIVNLSVWGSKAKFAEPGSEVVPRVVPKYKESVM